MTPMQQIFLGMGAVAKKTYVDDLFSTHLYTGNATARSINTGVDMTEGGLVWIKSRSNARANTLFDTTRGVNKYLLADHNHAENSTHSDLLTAFNNNGFSLGADANSDNVNRNDYTQASWSFRKAPGFFTLTSWVGNATAGRTITHDLGCVPGMIIIKNVSDAEDWYVYHRGTDATEPQDYITRLNTSGARQDWGGAFHDSAPTSSSFQIGDGGAVNDNGKTYIAYLFAGGESGAATARSVVFDGTGDYLSTSSSSSDFTMGTGDFTIEAWVKLSDTSNSGVCHLSATSGGLTTSNPADDIGIFANSGVWKCWAAGNTRTTSFNTVVGVWTHVALVRHSGKTTLYVNGTQGFAPVTDTNNYDDTYIAVGGYYDTNYLLNGSISNFRVVKGTAVYTSSFKPPTKPLTNITNTKLLCCNDSSTTGSTVTPVTINANGDPTASTNSAFDDPAGFVFGENEDQNVIKTGSYVGNGDSSNPPEIYLGFEPSWLLIKNVSSGSTVWQIFDVIRSLNGSATYRLEASSTSAENTGAQLTPISATGFTAAGNGSYQNSDGDTYIYLALRRPDGYVGKPYGAGEGTSVFAIDTGAGSATIPGFDSGFPVDFALVRNPATGMSWETCARLIQGRNLMTDTNAAETTYGASDFTFDSNVGWLSDSGYNSTYQSWMWKRHAGFDVVTYDGSSATSLTLSHSLNAIPEMIWVKCRSEAEGWRVYHKGLNGGTNPEQYRLILNLTSDEADSSTTWNDTAPTSTHFTVGDDGSVNDNGRTYLAMLFASVDGISKVGSYTGTGNALSVTTGFQPRFLMIKNISTSTGDSHWWNVDTTRGWGSGDESANRLDTNNSTTSVDLGAPTSTGFDIPANSGNSTAYNRSGDTYIYYCHA